MARIEEIAWRLRNWARWRVCGGGMLGYASVTLSIEALGGGDRDPHAAAAVPINDVEASETDDAVKLLGTVLRETVGEYYLGRGGMADHLQRLRCAEATLHARLARADMELLLHLRTKREARQKEAVRVRQVTHQNRAATFTP